ncbi:MAG: hypothetical protein ACLFPL_05255 [Candidatus Nanoarchaeia archaeon]
MAQNEENIEVTEMDVIEEAHLRIDALLEYLEKKGIGSVQEFEEYFETYIESLDEE